MHPKWGFGFIFLCHCPVVYCPYTPEIGRHCRLGNFDRLLVTDAEIDSSPYTPAAIAVCGNWQRQLDAIFIFRSTTSGPVLGCRVLNDVHK
jgi:hypothetical protein